MRFTIFTICSLVFNLTVSFSQTNKTTLKPDNKIASGLYPVIIDNSKKVGLKLENSQEYYAIIKENGMSINNIDTVYSEFNEGFKSFLLTIKLNKNGQKELIEFTTKYKQQKIGFVLNNKLIAIPTIFEPITTGGLTITLNFTKEKIEHIVLEIKNTLIQKQ
jgi:preprotein translocase subunit SecD